MNFASTAIAYKIQLLDKTTHFTLEYENPCFWPLWKLSLEHFHYHDKFKASQWSIQYYATCDYRNTQGHIITYQSTIIKHCVKDDFTSIWKHVRFRYWSNGNYFANQGKSCNNYTEVGEMTKCAQNGWDLFISIDQMSERSADTRTQTTRADPRKWLLESDNYEICLRG
jgi:hypothetical protein